MASRARPGDRAGKEKSFFLLIWVTVKQLPSLNVAEWVTGDSVRGVCSIYKPFLLIFEAYL